MLFGYLLTLTCVGLTRSILTFRKVGWLDRMVEYHKKQFLADVDTMPPQPIIATVQKAPPGYVDSPAWDYNSVMRLITLVHSSEQARPALAAIRRALRPTRRQYKPFQNTFKLWPSIAKDHPNYFYYDVDSSEYLGHSGEFQTIAQVGLHVIYIANPVEARLPSAHISVKLLREIMEKRAEAARAMPVTEKSTILWKTKNVTTPNTEETTVLETTSEAAPETTTAEAETTGAEGASGAPPITTVAA